MACAPTADGREGSARLRWLGLGRVLNQQQPPRIQHWFGPEQTLNLSQNRYHLKDLLSLRRSCDPMSFTQFALPPFWSLSVPVAGAALLGGFAADFVDPDGAAGLIVAAILLLATVFAAVHHAEILALRIGEPLGSILLSLAVTIIEVALIISIMRAGGQGSDVVARDAVFAAVMIVLNGVVGLCLILGGQRYHEQRFQLDGAASALAVLGTLAVIAFVLPNHTIATLGPTYAPLQLVVAGAASLVLYCTFIFVQTVSHRKYFLDKAARASRRTAELHRVPAPQTTAVSALLLPLALIVVVLLAKVLSHPLERGVAAVGLPREVVGVVIAAVVLLPEVLAATTAAIRNRVQSSLNVTLGSALASIGLTIPVVATVSLLLDLPLVLGLSSENTVLLLLTLFVGTLTLGTGRTTVLQGVIHLAIFAMFLLLVVVP
jgi:Ca2+:H+ antiporter